MSHKPRRRVSSTKSCRESLGAVAHTLSNSGPSSATRPNSPTQVALEDVVVDPPPPSPPPHPIIESTAASPPASLRSARPSSLPLHDEPAQLDEPSPLVASPAQQANTEGAVGQDASHPEHNPKPGKGDTPLEEAAPSIDQKTAFWEKYNKAGDIEDKEFVKASGGDLDVLLIFAGLFSATNTAFIIESYKGLKPDPVDQTNQLLHSVLLAIQNTAATTPESPLFAIAPRDVRINICFFFSLCCSLSAAFGAVLAKQWLTQYDRDGGGALKPPFERGRERQLKYEARDKWGLEHIIATLPTLLQFSLFFFLVGLVDFVWPLNTPVASIVIAFASLTFLFYTATTLVAVINSSSPFQTRISPPLRAAMSNLGELWTNASNWCFWGVTYTWWRIKRSLRREPWWRWPAIMLSSFQDRLQGALRANVFRVATWQAWVFWKRTEGQGRDATATQPEPSVDMRCMVYLLERMTGSDDLGILADALDGMSGHLDARTAMETLVVFHLKPSLGAWWWNLPGLYGSTRKQVLKILHILVVKWRHFDGVADSVTPSLSHIGLQDLLQALCAELWRAFLEQPKDMESKNCIIAILSTLPPDPRTQVDHLFNVKGPNGNSLLTHLYNEDDSKLQEYSLALLLASIHHFHDSEVYKTFIRVCSGSTNVLQLLKSTMWMDGATKTPALSNLWMGIMKIQVLPALLPDDILSSGFAEYLALWFHHHAKPDWEYMVRNQEQLYHRKQDATEQLWLYWSYLVALQRLVTGKDAQTWAMELIKHGHLSCLHSILSDFPSKYTFRGAPLALYAIFFLWSCSTLEGVADGIQAPCLVKEHVRIVTHLLGSGYVGTFSAQMQMDQMQIREENTLALKVQLLEMKVQMMPWLVSYIQAAISKQFLSQEEVWQVIQGFQGYCDEGNYPVVIDDHLAKDLEGIVLSSQLPFYDYLDISE